MPVDPPAPAQAHAEDDAPSEKTEEAEPEPVPPDEPDTPDEVEPDLGTYDDGRFEPL
ncbi:hypothetical protein [Streptomyces sp. NPDC002588]|uniref:hypothetical protein n=1 Tax=Streptomyces sp. NPDC002588 TaxID=3154419 RepID=UPI00332283EF